MTRNPSLTSLYMSNFTGVFHAPFINRQNFSSVDYSYKKTLCYIL